MSDKLQAAKDAIDRLFNDTSYSVREAMDNMAELKSEIEMKIDALESDLTDKE